MTQSKRARSRACTRPNWSRPLPRPLTIPTIMDLVTLADLRALIGHLPKETRARKTWQHVERELKKAAAGGDAMQIVDRAADGADVGKRGGCRPEVTVPQRGGGACSSRDG